MENLNYRKATLLLMAVFLGQYTFAESKFYCNREQSPPSGYFGQLIRNKFSGDEVIVLNGNKVDGVINRDFEHKSSYRFKLNETLKLEDINICTKAAGSSRIASTLCVLGNLTYKPTRDACLEKCLVDQIFSNELMVEKVNEGVLSISYTLEGNRYGGKLYCFEENAIDYHAAFNYVIYANSYNFSNIIKYKNDYFVAKPENSATQYLDRKYEIFSKDKQNVSLDFSNLSKKLTSNELKVLDLSMFKEKFPLEKVKRAECLNHFAVSGDLSTFNGGRSLVIESDSAVDPSKKYTQFSGELREENKRVKLFRKNREVPVFKISEEVFTFGEFLCFLK